MPREGGDEGRSEENASQRRARGYGNNADDGKEDYRYAASTNANTELPASHMAKVWPR